MKATDLIDNDSLRDDIPDFQAGDELKVHVRVVEGGKERIQVFQGDVIAQGRPDEIRTSAEVRRVYLGSQA